MELSLLLPLGAIAILAYAFGREAQSVLAARRFAREEHDGIARIVGGCRSREFGIRSGFPVVVLDIGDPSSRFVVFSGSRRAAKTVPTDELALQWSGPRLGLVEHEQTGTKFAPGWTPVRPSSMLEPGMPLLPPRT